MINGLIFPAPSPSSYSCASLSASAAGGTGHTLLHIPLPPATATATSAFTFGLLVHCPTPSPYLVLYAHPNAVDVGMMTEEMEFFARRSGCHVLLWEYEGYGVLQDTADLVGTRSDAAEPGEESLCDAMAAVYAYCLTELKVPSSNIVLMGRSIGTGPSTWLASQPHIAATSPPLLLFLQAPFTSIVDCCRTFARQQTTFGAGLLESLAGMVVADRFRNVDAIRSVCCPVVIQHGDLDEIVAYSHALRIVESAKSAGKTDIFLHTSRGFGHNNLSVSEAAKLLATTLRGLTPSNSGHQNHLPLSLRPLHYHCALPSVAEALFEMHAAVNAKPRSSAVDAAAAAAGVPSPASSSSVSQLVLVSQLEAALSHASRVGDVLRQRVGFVPLLLVGVARLVCVLARMWQQARVVADRQRAQQYGYSNKNSGAAAVAGGGSAEGSKGGVRNLYSWWSAPSASSSTSSSQPPPPPPTTAISVLSLFEEFVAVSGNPLGVYVTEVKESGRWRRCGRVFGLAIASCSEAADDSRPIVFDHDVAGGGGGDDDDRRRWCRAILLELHWPPYLIRDVVAMVEAAPDVLAAGVGSVTDPFLFLSKAQLDRLQMQLERYVGFLPDDEWVQVQTILRQGLDSVASSLNSAQRQQPPFTAATLSALELHDKMLALRASTEQQQQQPQQLQSSTDKQRTKQAWEELLCNAKNRASNDSFIHQRKADGTDVVVPDPMWQVAREIHREFVRVTRRHEEVNETTKTATECIGGGGRSTDHAAPAPKRRADEDCCLM